MKCDQSTILSVAPFTTEDEGESHSMGVDSNSSEGEDDHAVKYIIERK